MKKLLTQIPNVYKKKNGKGEYVQWTLFMRADELQILVKLEFLAKKIYSLALAKDLAEIIQEKVCQKIEHQQFLKSVRGDSKINIIFLKIARTRLNFQEIQKILTKLQFFYCWKDQ